MNTHDYKAVKNLLESPKKIVVIPHRNPDGDAIGACLAMQHYLQRKNHKVTVVSPNELPSFLMWIPAANEILKFDKQNRQSKKAIQEAELIFLLDFNALNRVGDDMQNTLNDFKGIYLMIDHHLQPEFFATYTFSDISYCATCEMVYDFIDQLGDKDLIDKTIATCIYTGIMTDTGNFRFPATKPRTHQIVAKLMEKGADNAFIYTNVFDSNTYQNLQLLGFALTKLQIIPKANTAFFALSKNDLKVFDYQKGDTEGIVNYGLSIKGVYLAAIFIEDEDQGIIKISFRSKGTFSVNNFARNYFDGGGHQNAAGARSTLSLEETIDKFVELVNMYKNEISKSYDN
ncbi:MAG: bifunctional oligoribonuclease/PAP phosphatase NrnA [Flavobacteriaceae bacterium]|nr:bifunctional oligoribonuclease/PAP phosphatase NrnA [Flavobacteriaceae bacterium]